MTLFESTDQLGPASILFGWILAASIPLPPSETTYKEEGSAR